MESNRISRFTLILAVLALLIIVLAAFVIAYSTNPGLFESIITTYGVLGLFIGAIIANASILLPVPIDIFVFLFGETDFFGLGIFTPLLLGIIVGFGAAIGEMSGYLLGLMGIKGLEEMQQKEIAKIHEIKEKINNLGSVFIALGAFTPFPFDVIGLAAGLIKYDVKKFFIACSVGKIARYIAISYAGYFSIAFIKTLLA